MDWFLVFAAFGGGDGVSGGAAEASEEGEDGGGLHVVGRGFCEAGSTVVLLIGW